MIAAFVRSIVDATRAVQTRLGAVLTGADPLGPNDLDLDDVRDSACGATTPASVCDAPDVPAPTPTPSDPTSGGGGGLGGLGQLLLLLLVAALVVALGWIIWQFVAGRSVHGKSDEVDEDDLDEDEELDDDGPRIVDEDRPPDRWRRAAAEHRANGAFRDAVRCEYRALVGELARAGYVDEIPGRTSGEERAQVATIAGPDADVVARFDEAADLFDVAWFDDRPINAGDDARFVELADEVRETVLAGAGTAASRRRADRGGSR